MLALVVHRPEPPSPRIPTLQYPDLMRALRLTLARCIVRRLIPAVFRRVNPLVVRLLHSPLRPLLGRRVIVVRYEGRRTGRTYRVPVRCRLDDSGALYAMTSARAVWWRNLEGASRTPVRYRGREYEARIEVVRGADATSEVERALAARDAVSRLLLSLPASESVLLRVWL